MCSIRALPVCHFVDMPAMNRSIFSLVESPCMFVQTVPLAFVYLKEPHQRKRFTDWNFSSFLVNVHLLNLPLAATTHLLRPRHFVAQDGWISLAAALCYLAFYLFVMDPLGLHFYIILSPRTKMALVWYSVLLLFLYAIYHSWKAMTHQYILFLLVN